MLKKAGQDVWPFVPSRRPESTGRTYASSYSSNVEKGNGSIGCQAKPLLKAIGFKRGKSYKKP
jgi:hypothetical protein